MRTLFNTYLHSLGVCEKYSMDCYFLFLGLSNHIFILWGCGFAQLLFGFLLFPILKKLDSHICTLPLIFTALANFNFTYPFPSKSSFGFEKSGFPVFLSHFLNFKPEISGGVSPLQRLKCRSHWYHFVSSLCLRIILSSFIGYLVIKMYYKPGLIKVAESFL